MRPISKEQDRPRVQPTVSLAEVIVDAEQARTKPALDPVPA